MDTVNQRRNMTDKEDSNMWRIRNVPLETRKKVKLFALRNDLTVGEALTALIDKGLKSE
jgi:hypothetical protein